LSDTVLDDVDRAATPNLATAQSPRSTVVELVHLDPATYEPHSLHRTERSWTETNCWQDMMIEVLNVLGLDPLAPAAFTLSADFEGSQWTLFKYPPEDLRALYGIDIAELYVWRPVIDHLETALSDGQLLTVEVDAYYLPDTAGVTYRTDHTKTGIVPQMLDRQGRRLGYFHNAGYFELSGEDFSGIFYLDGKPDPHVLLPYVEVVHLDRIRRPGPEELTDKVRALVREHLARAPETNPMQRFKQHLAVDIPWIQQNGEAGFHPYAFATCRQCGASAELAAAFVDWLDQRDGGGIEAAAEGFRDISVAAKSLQFALARVARGKQIDLDGPFERMGHDWQQAMSLLRSRYAS